MASFARPRRALYTLPDDQAEYQLRGRLAVMRFLGRGIEDAVPGAKTLWPRPCGSLARRWRRPARWKNRLIPTARGPANGATSDRRHRPALDDFRERRPVCII